MVWFHQYLCKTGTNTMIYSPCLEVPSGPLDGWSWLRCLVFLFELMHFLFSLLTWLKIRTCRDINSEEISCQLLTYQPQDFFFQTKGIQCITVNLTLISQRNILDSPYCSFPSLSGPDRPSFNSILLGTTFFIQAHSQHSFIPRNLYKQLVCIVFNLLDFFAR